MRHVTLLAAFLALVVVAPRTALAHCDTLDGPVVADARQALEAKDVTPVLKWVPADDESEIREALRRSLAVRGLGAEARDLADRSFFETLVRVHRAGEGAPYAGLKPVGTPAEPGVAATDAALASGNVEPLVALVAREVGKGLRERHARAVEARRHVAHGVEHGREYVAAYVDLVHRVEALLAAAAPSPEPPPGHGAGHRH